MTAENFRRDRWAWIFLALGSAGVIVVSVFYYLSPAQAVLPQLGADLAGVRSATLTDIGFMRLAGAFGVAADPLISFGAFALAGRAWSHGNGREAVGMYALACAGLLYTLVDALVGYGLHPAAAGGQAMFDVVKPLFDAIMGSASISYGLSGLLIGWPLSAAGSGPRWIRVGLFVAGSVVFGSGVLALCEVAPGPVLGAGLASTTTLYTLLGCVEAFRGRR